MRIARVSAALSLAACGPRLAPASTPTPDRFASLRAEVDAAKDPDAKIVAIARLADALWDASCPHTEARLCVAHARSPAGRAYCSGDAPPATMIATPRGPDAAEAIRFYEEIAGASPSDPDAKRAAMNARLTLADADAETFYAIAPTAPSADFKHAYGPWLEQVEDAAQRAIVQYQAIASDSDAGMIAAAQIGRVTYELGWRIITLPVPESIARSADAMHLFCDGLGAKVGPIFMQASQRFAACAKRADQSHGSGAFPTMCRRGRP